MMRCLVILLSLVLNLEQIAFAEELVEPTTLSTPAPTLDSTQEQKPPETQMAEETAPAQEQIAQEHPCEMGAVSGVNFFRTMIKSATSHPTPKAAPGGGLYARYALPGSLSLELGVLYKKYRMMTSQTTTTDTFQSGQMLQFPLLVRYWVFQRLSFGVGAYYSSYMGTITNEFVGTSKTTETTQTYDSAVRKKSDIGYVVNLGGRFPFGESRFSITGDVRYYGGLSNNSTSPYTELAIKTQAFEFLAGMSLGI